MWSCFSIIFEGMEASGYEAPKMAIIRLLRAQGCCPCEEDPRKYAENEQLVRARQEMQMRVAQERSRLAQVPCVVTLAAEIEELREVVGGLGRENRGRMEVLRKMKTKGQSNHEGQTEEQLEHQKLQQEYANLLRTLESTNETNRRLVERLTRG